ncbi:hypothetical protein FB451DRAFT_1406352 [Mycena latifolia]|nr:hypothetical protein FB451DRAFT_1406352 [Mycena latifolia]
MYSSQHFHRLVDPWQPAQHRPPGNGVRSHLFDGPHANDYRRAARDRQQDHHIPPYHQRVPMAHRGDWRPVADKTFSPASRPHEHLLVELEPLSRYSDGQRVPQYYSPPRGANTANNEDFIDLTALADQYLDLSGHCLIPSRSTSPYSDSTQASDAGYMDGPPSKRRRMTEVGFRRSLLYSAYDLTILRPQHLPRLPPIPTSDDEGDDEFHRGAEHTGLSPFYYSPSPPHHEAELPTQRQPSYTSHTAHRPAHPPASALKFTEARNDGRSKRQALACFFCRKRKIACGGPPKGSADQTCNQCTRRGVECGYPTESKRGQHSRIKSLARQAQEANHLHNHVGMLLPILHHRH